MFQSFLFAFITFTMYRKSEAPLSVEPEQHSEKKRSIKNPLSKLVLFVMLKQAIWDTKHAKITPRKKNRQKNIMKHVQDTDYLAVVISMFRSTMIVHKICSALNEYLFLNFFLLRHRFAFVYFVNFFCCIRGNERREKNII